MLELTLSDFIGHDYGKGNRRIKHILTCKDNIKRLRKWCTDHYYRDKYYFMPRVKEDGSLLCGLGKIEWSDGSTTLINIMDIVKEDWRLEFIDREEFRIIADKLISAGEAVDVVDVKEFIEC